MFLIKAEGPKMGLQLGLVPAAWEVIRVAQLDELLFVMTELIGELISSWNGHARKK
jgi:hypothetical protein